MTSQDNLKILSDFLKENGGFLSLLGFVKIDVSKSLGQGGNGIVYSSMINDVEIAVKFLINYNSQRLNRFKSEYINVNIAKDRLFNVINCLQYGELIIDDITVPYIIMNKYNESLKKYRKKCDSISFKEVKKLFESLAKSINSLEKENIIHRDLKPENILLNSNNDFIISDFGIAHFGSDNFPIRELTQKGERLANIAFSAPEQLKGNSVCWATDLYSFGQILYWFVFEEISRGSGRRHLQECYPNEREAFYLDNVISMCLYDNPKDRPQSIKEICDKIYEWKSNDNEINPFDDMTILSRIARSTVPEFFGKGAYTENLEEIRSLVEKISMAKTNKDFEYNTGNINNSISIFSILENGHFLLNQREIIIKRVWGLFGNSVYNDLLILETQNPAPYIIKSEEHYAVAVINQEEIVPIDNITSGYVRYKGKVVNTNELDIQERYIETIIEDKYFFIGAFHQCSMLSVNDKYLEKFQELDNITLEDLYILRQRIEQNKTHDVAMYI